MFMSSLSSGIIRLKREVEEVFQLDLAVYKEAQKVDEQYLSESFQNNYDYALYSFIFHPRDKVLLVIHSSILIIYPPISR